MTMAEGSHDPMGQSQAGQNYHKHHHQHHPPPPHHRHQQQHDLLNIHPLVMNHNIAWKQRKRKRLSAVLDKLHHNNNNVSTVQNNNSAVKMSKDMLQRIKAEEADEDEEEDSEMKVPCESSEDDRSEAAYSTSDSSPRITISPLRLGELDEPINTNNNNNNNKHNNNNNPNVMNKNTLLSSSHLLSQISPHSLSHNIKQEHLSLPSPPTYHPYFPVTSPLYYLQNKYLPELLRRRSNSDSDLQTPETLAIKPPVDDGPLDLSMKTAARISYSLSLAKLQQNNNISNMNKKTAHSPPISNGSNLVKRQQQQQLNHQSNGISSNNNSHHQYNYQQHYLTQQQQLLAHHHQQQFFQSQQQRLFTKISSPSPSSWSSAPTNITPNSISGSSSFLQSANEQESGNTNSTTKLKSSKSKNKHQHHHNNNNNCNMASLNVKTTLFSNLLPSGSVGVPIIKGDVASPTTKESVASRYNLDVSPVVEEMPPGSDVAYVCPVCGQMFSLHDRLAKHMASRHKSRNTSNNDITKAYVCEVCQRSFARSDMLTRHMRLHTGIKPYTCKVCGQVFSRSDHLSTHQRTHTGEKPYKCPQCPYAACRRDMITRHMRTHTRYDAQQQRTSGNPYASQSPSIHVKMEPLVGGESPPPNHLPVVKMENA